MNQRITGFGLRIALIPHDFGSLNEADAVSTMVRHIFSLKSTASETTVPDLPIFVVQLWRRQVLLVDAKLVVRLAEKIMSDGGALRDKIVATVSSFIRFLSFSVLGRVTGYFSVRMLV